MAVFTEVSLDEVNAWLAHYDLGEATALKGIARGIENSNFFLSTTRGEYVLTLFEKLTPTELPFYLNLMGHLDAAGIPCPGPTKARDGDVFKMLNGKPAAVVRRLQGQWMTDPSIAQISAVGAMLAHMHVQGQNYRVHQPNPRGPDWWQETAPQVMPFLDAANAALLQEEMARQHAFRQDARERSALPSGPIHADLFRDNVLFEGDQLGGFIDFYFAGCDAWLFDVAVCLNDWCIVREPAAQLGRLDMAKANAFLAAYASVRPFNVLEIEAWAPTLRAAALRFWLSRLYDFHLPRASALLTPHDPTHFEHVLRARLAEESAGTLPRLPLEGSLPPTPPSQDPPPGPLSSGPANATVTPSAQTPIERTVERTTAARRSLNDHRDFNPNQLPASAGWMWIVLGWRLYRRAPLTWLVMLGVMYVGLSLVASLPVIGGVVAIALIPGVGAGFMVIASLIERGLPVLPAAFVVPFRAQAQAQLTLGLAYVALLGLALAASSLVDDGVFVRWLLNRKGMLAPPGDDALTAGVIWGIAYVPVTAALWFSPALVHDAHMPPFKALFFSFFACVRNLGAFLVYSLAWVAILFAIGSALLFIASLVSAKPAALAVGALMPILFMLMAVLYATFYVSYVTVFSKPKPQGTAE